MKKSILFAALVFLLVPWLILIRQITLSQLDCKFCRQFASLLAQPNDYNRPIAMIEVKGQESTLNLIPNYVGWYRIQFYRTEIDATTAIDVTVNEIKCKPDMQIKILNTAPDLRNIYSKYGSGTMLGFLFVSPAEIRSKSLVHCKIILDSIISGNLIVSRFSEN